MAEMADRDRNTIGMRPIGFVSRALPDENERDRSLLWVRGLDAYDGTPVLDVKPYPDWEHGHFIIVTDFKVPGWLTEIMERQENAGQAGD